MLIAHLVKRQMSLRGDDSHERMNGLSWQVQFMQPLPGSNALFRSVVRRDLFRKLQTPALERLALDESQACTVIDVDVSRVRRVPMD